MKKSDLSTLGLAAVTVGVLVGCASQTAAEPAKAPAKTPAPVAAAVQPASAPKARPDSPSLLKSKMPFKFGVARYTMHKHPFDRTLAILKNIDCHYLGLVEKTISYDATDAEIAAYKAKCAAYGVEVVSSGPNYVSTEAEIAKMFAFAKRYGMTYISCVPYEERMVNGKKVRAESDKAMDLIEKYVKMYDIRAAVHNHGPDIPYCYPTAEAALKRIGSRDKRLGVCLDVGHEMRAGCDPVAFIREHGDRIYEVHIKNIQLKPYKAKEGPRGELDIPGILQSLADNGFGGYCLIEFEKDFDCNEAPLAESLGYYRGVADAIRVKPRMAPVPAGANTLTAAEKAEGWELLFDGKRLPTEQWVGEKEGFKRFPTKGWYAENGALYMKPTSGIAPNGKWFPLPPEDARLGGGGSIVTVKKFRDFAFKFDFRLTPAANSGIKYYYDETVNNKGTCEEYQVLDAGHPDYDKPNPSGVEGTHRIGALYDLAAAPLAEKVVKPTGQWNSGMIVAKGSHVEHWLNGVKILEYERGSDVFRKWVDVSKYAKWGNDAAGKPQRWGEVPCGRIHIQDHTDSCVSYCNLKVRAL